MQWFFAVLQNSLLCVAPAEVGVICYALWKKKSVFVVLDWLLRSVAHQNVPVGKKKAN